MRHWVLVLFLALLPWRLWAADAMALERISWPAPPVQHVPCHGDTEGHDASAHGADPSPHDPHGLCLLCDVCHNTYWLTPQTPVSAHLTVHDTPLDRVERVASADRQPGFKPPIR